MVSPYDPVGPAQLGIGAPGLGGHIPGQPIYIPPPTTNNLTITQPYNGETIPVTGPGNPTGQGASGGEGGNSILSGLGNFAKGVASTILPAASIAKSVAGPKSSVATSLPPDKMLAQLVAAGYDTPTANSLITKYNQTAAKNAALKNLPPEFADIIKQHDADTAAAAQPQGQRIMDPLAMQLFFQNTIAPYLDKTSQGIKATAAGMGQTMQGLMPSLPPAYQAVLSQSLPGAQAGMAAMGDAMSGAAVAAPAVQQLQAQLSAAWQAQKLAQYYAEKNIAYSGGANSSGVPTADEIAQITQLLGSGNTGTGQ